MSSFQALKAKRDGRTRPTNSVSASTADADDLVRTAVQAEPVASGSKLDVASYDIPPGIEARQATGRGRGLYAKLAYKSGSRILRTKPLVSVNSTKNLSLYCSVCHLAPAEIVIARGPGTELPTLKRCLGCKVVFYCSQVVKKCQAEDWPVHREECTAHKRLRAEYVKLHGNVDLDVHQGWIMNEKYRALGRLCWARKKENRNGHDPSWWKQIEAMESHIKRMSSDQVMELGQQIQRFRQYLSAAASETAGLGNLEDFGFSKSAELLNLFSAFQINSFTLSSPSLSPIGVAMSPLVALCNHSCEPNAVVVFPQGGKQMDIVAIRPISPGEEILTSYIDVSLPFVHRQSDLKARYGFDCDCTLCQKSASSSWIDPRCCTFGQDGKSLFAMTDDATLRDLSDRGRAVLADDEKGLLDPKSALSRLATLVPELSGRMPPSSHPLLALLRLRALLLCPPANKAEHEIASHSLALAYAGAEQVYPSGHPTLAIISAEWSKLAAMDLPEQDHKQARKRLTDAVVELRKTLQLCEIGFGPGAGLVGREMADLLKGCEMELEQRGIHQF